MRSKFGGGYTVDLQVIAPLIKRSDGFYEAVVMIWGNIEIGTEIELGNWRSEWLTEHLFGELEKDKYELINVQNKSGGGYTRVIGVWRKK